jgi:hypothetical protein
MFPVFLSKLTSLTTSPFSVTPRELECDCDDSCWPGFLPPGGWRRIEILCVNQKRLAHASPENVGDRR